MLTMMIYKALEILVAVVLFFSLKYIVYFITEKIIPFPEWLDYKPYTCSKCFGFWLPLGVYLSIFYIVGNIMVPALGIILTALDTVAKIIDEKNKYQ